jgi:hypothetical protein
MPNKKIFILVLSFLIVGMLIACKPPSSEASNPTHEPIILGYCPTMTPYVESLVESGYPVNAVQFENSMRAIEALNAGAVQSALIGRTARDFEIGEGIGLVRIKDGYTLIAQTQGGIPYEALSLVRILTMEENRDAAEILPPGTAITYYQDFDQMLSEMDGNSAVILRWSELPPAYQLLIPFDGQGNKIPEFRSPHLYYAEGSELNFTQMIDTLSSQE